MSNWRDKILSNFIPGTSKLTLVADPDSLLTEEKLSTELRNRGFDIIQFSDVVEFRYNYELNYREPWNKENDKEKMVIILTQSLDINELPYDLLKSSRKLSFGLAFLFPNLSYPIITKLDKAFLDLLFDAQKKYPPDRMGDNATNDYILRHAFGIATELIKNEVDMLRMLLRIHYNKINIPKLLHKRLIQILNQNKTFSTWPLNQIVPDAKAFFEFLQERWPIFVDKINSENYMSEKNSYDLIFPGPKLLPFDHHDIRIYIDNLFIEGKLNPIEKIGTSIQENSWINIGIKDQQNQDVKRIDYLFGLIENQLPPLDSRYSDWISFASKWAELNSLIYEKEQHEHFNRLMSLKLIVNERFAKWLIPNYHSLINLPPITPTMGHHIPRYLARRFEEDKINSIALIVVDGLSYDQWITMRRILQEQVSNLCIRESALFSWIPTITSVSRQAIFAGKPPIYFPSSIETTNNEFNLWRQFWETHGFSRIEIGYQRGLSDENMNTFNDLNFIQTKVIGIVVNMVDKILHGMQLGSAGMINQIKQWCMRGFLSSLITNLMDNNYQVWLTSDHGNIESKGRGCPSEGVIAEVRGERARIYPSIELRSSIARTYPYAIEWQTIGLPPDYFPLVSQSCDAFIKDGKSIVAHGGIAIEEVIVPFVKFERKK